MAHEPAPSADERGAAGGAVAADAIRDPGRLQALDASGLLDTLPEESFDRYTRLAARVLNTPIALVSLVAEHRQFFKSQVGVPPSLRETPLSHSFCKHVVATSGPLVIHDAREDPRVRDNPAVQEFGVLAYLGMPLVTSAGFALGSFCAVDTRARRWSDDDVAFVRDLTAAVMTEIELRDVSRRLHQSYTSLQQLEKQRDDLVHMVVHDLRNPLTSLLAGLDLLRDAPELTATAALDLDGARQAAFGLVEMVGDILDVQRADAVGLPVTRRLVDPTALCEQAHKQVAHLATAAGVSLSAACHHTLQPILADERQMRRVLVNLLSNAIQHTARGRSVTLAVEALPDDGVRFSVRDCGCGIPADAVPRLFDKFRQPSLRGPGGHRSTGLGLPFCKLAVEAHGGRLWVESEVGRGSTFHVELPGPSGAAITGVG